MPPSCGEESLSIFLGGGGDHPQNFFFFGGGGGISAEAPKANYFANSFFFFGGGLPLELEVCVCVWGGGSSG